MLSDGEKTILAINKRRRNFRKEIEKKIQMKILEHKNAIKIHWMD